MLIFDVTREKSFEVQSNFNTNTTLGALFEIRFKSFFFDIEKSRQCGELTTIA